MPALLAHAGEETLYVLIPVLVIVVLVHLGKRRNRPDDDPPAA